MTPQQRTAVVKSAARAVGFDLVGIADAAPLAAAAHYRDWLAAGYAGSMAYLHKHPAERANPAVLLAGARSVVCVALSYARAETSPAAAAAGAAAGAGPTGRVARYAQGRDYHDVLRALLRTLRERLAAELGETFDARICVDTAPVMERELARLAGLGWIGKNALLLNPQLSSYLVLGEIVTTLELAPDQPMADHCGRCRRCLDACPTRAFPQPHVLDARRCIAYLTIEHRGPIDAELQPLMGDWVFGCDVCQEVCPFNQRAPEATNTDLAANRTPGRVPLTVLQHVTSGDHRRLTRGSATRRASVKMWRRNAGIAQANQPPAG